MTTQQQSHAFAIATVLFQNQLSPILITKFLYRSTLRETEMDGIAHHNFDTLYLHIHTNSTKNTVEQHGGQFSPL